MFNIGSALLLRVRYRPARVVSIALLSLATAAPLVMGCRSAKRNEGGAGAAGTRPGTTRITVTSRPSAPVASTREMITTAPTLSAPQTDASTPLSPEDFDIGPALHVSLGPFGVAALAGDESLVVAPFRDGVPTSITAPANPASVAPAIAPGSPSRAYWVSGGKLVRAKISPEGIVGPTETLAQDAKSHTRVGVAHTDSPVSADVVVYLARSANKDAPRVAKVWVEGQGTRALTPDGAGASSVDVVSLGSGKFALLSLDGRLSMSPVHARSLELDASGVPNLGEDRVVSVAGPAERDSELVGIQIGMGPVLLTTISKETTEFGLLSLRIGYGDGDAPSWWYLYPNGITPAPVAAVMLCGKPTVAFVQPATASPTSKKLLVVGGLDGEGHVVNPTPIGQADAVRSVALAASPGASPPHAIKGGAKAGAWLAWSADNRLRLKPLMCQ